MKVEAQAAVVAVVEEWAKGAEHLPPGYLAALRRTAGYLLNRWPEVKEAAESAGMPVEEVGRTSIGEFIDKHAQDHTLTIGEITIDRRSRRVWREGVEVELTSTQFDIFSLLMSRPGQVCTRDLILQRVWGCSPGGRVVDVHIWRIRERLGDLHIRTKRGHGYFFEP